MAAKLPAAAAQAHATQTAALGLGGATPSNVAPVSAGPVPVAVPAATPAPASAPAAAPVAPPVSHSAPAAFAPGQPPTGGETPEMAAIRQALAQSQQEAETLRNRQSGADKARTDAEQTLQLLTENATFMQARLKELADENQRLNAERSAEAQQQAETAADIALPISNEAVTESEQKKFGGDTEAYVRKIVNLELSKVLAPILARVKELSVFRGDIGRRVESTEQATAAMARPMLKIIGKGFVEEEVLPHFPDFVTRRTSPEWKSFIQSTDHASGKTFGELLRDTMATQDALVARGIIGRFYLGHPSTATPTAPSGISTEPATSASGAGSTTPQMAPSGTVPAFAFSRYKNATAQYTKKQITQAQLQAIKGEFEIASAAGTVDYAR